MEPLAERLRPQTVADYIGQEHLVGEGQVLRKAVEAGMLPSMILWGPPGVGKTSLAHILARATGRPFFELSAINAGVKDIREVIEKAKKQQFFSSPAPVLFIDEIHRFSKSQQDALLGAVERGTVILIGATTENPSFEVIPALRSRAQTYVLKPLSVEALKKMVDDALQRDKVLRERGIKVHDYDALLRVSGGDARKLYNALELVSNQPEARQGGITNELVRSVIQENLSNYDKGGEQHYDIASALIKSIRGSDPNASLYWLARMLDGGESIEFIARRLVISASEDIGMANPNALLLATSGMQAIRMVGMPEAKIILSQIVVYLATSAKSNASYSAIKSAIAEVKRSGNLPVPLHLRNAPTKLMKSLDYGKNYDYVHDNPNNFGPQQYAPDDIANVVYYVPGANPAENRIRERLEYWWPERYPKSS